MTRPLHVRAIVFDMDGLVLDSESSYFLAWQTAAERLGYRLSQTFCQSLSGMHGPEISRRLLEHFGPDFDIENFYRLSSQIWQHWVQQHGIPVKTGFYQLLAWIRRRGLPYALATNSRRADAEQCLHWAGLHAAFSNMICNEDVARPKPAPDIFIKSAQILGVEPADCLVLEDSAIGIAAAVAANCPSIFVPSLLPADPKAASQANRVMHDLAQVTEFLSASFDHPL